MGTNTHHHDWITLVLLLCLGSYGLFLLLTVSFELFYQQLLFFGISIVLLIFCRRIDKALLWWFAPFGYIGSILFLALSYMGPEIRGATRWISIMGVQFQPSELVKPFLLLAFSYFLSRYSPRKIQHIVLHIALFALPFSLVFFQPDFGSSLVYAGFWLFMMLAGGLSPIFLFFGVGIIGASTPVLWHILADYQRSRIYTFLNPRVDPQGAGYNALQSMIAVGSGQLFGRGLGRGTQSHLRFLPEYHTDFIFATLVEELGFLGAMLLYACYGMLLWQMLSGMIKEHMESTSFIYGIGLFAMLLIQISINTGMNMGILPITGITLPFISYGGSSLLSLSLAFGFYLALQSAPTVDRIVANG